MAAPSILFAGDVDASNEWEPALVVRGWRVTHAVDGEEAIECAVRLRPAVALIDLDLPGIDGYVLGKVLRTTAWGRAIRLIAVARPDHQTDEDLWRAAGYSTLVHRGTDAERLFSSLSNDSQVAR